MQGKEREGYKTRNVERCKERKKKMKERGKVEKTVRDIVKTKGGK